MSRCRPGDGDRSRIGCGAEFGPLIVISKSGRNCCPNGVFNTSSGNSSIYRGIPTPHKNWAISSEKLLQLCENRSYVLPLKLKKKYIKRTVRV